MKKEDIIHLPSVKKAQNTTGTWLYVGMKVRQNNDDAQEEFEIKSFATAVVVPPVILAVTDKVMINIDDITLEDE